MKSRMMLLFLCLFIHSCDKGSAGEAPTIYEGYPAKDGEFNEVGWIGNCTGTLVAPNVIFTAGHCRSTGSEVSFEHRPTGRAYKGECTRHPKYNARSIYNDYSFCILKEGVPDGSHLSQFDISTPVEAKDKLLLNGFGQPHITDLYWGSGEVRQIDGQDIITCGPSNLGGGDSGGSIYRWNEDRTDKVMRKIVGVNSRGGGGCSYFNQVAHQEFVEFAKDFESKNNLKLCGVSKDCENPQGPPPPPPPPPPPGPTCGQLYSRLAACFSPNFTNDMNADLSCHGAYVKFGNCLTE